VFAAAPGQAMGLRVGNEIAHGFFLECSAAHLNKVV
jgi:hypothetical protein